MKKLLLTLVLLSALIFRIFLAIHSKQGDMYNNWDWGQGMWVYGAARIYDIPQHLWPHSWPNQPPGSLFIHAFSYRLFTSIANISNTLNNQIGFFPSRFVWWWPDGGQLISLKLPSIISDFVIFWAVVKFGKFWHRPRLALAVGLVYLFNPALWYNSAFWGQTDSIVAALALLSLLFLLQKRLILSPLFLGLSFITKGSWLPMVPFYLFYWWKYYRRAWPKLLIIPGIFYLLALPFHPYLNWPIWFTRVYLTRILSGESAWITVIAFNFWNLFFPPAFTPVTVPIFGVPAFYLAWGLVAVFLGLLFYKLRSKPTPQTFIYALMLLFFAVFLFAPKMLQRYFYPVFPLLSLILIFSRRHIYWFIYGLVSFCYLINLYYQWWAPGSLFLESFYTSPFIKTISIIYLASFAVLYVQKDV